MFSVGEMVTGTPDAHTSYLITTSAATMKITLVENKTEVVVQLIDHKAQEHKQYIGQQFRMQTKYIMLIDIDNRRISNHV